MSNRTIILALFAVLLALGGWWFSQNFGFGPQRVWVGYSGEARVNPFFAARLLLEHLGFRVEQKAAFHKIVALPPRATLILAADRSALGADRSRYSAITVRTTLIWGAQDSLTPLDHRLAVMRDPSAHRTSTRRLRPSAAARSW